ncbi:MAG: hypothetical protein ABIK37_05055 [candidate division WOR-3 bacterium]
MVHIRALLWSAAVLLQLWMANGLSQRHRIPRYSVYEDASDASSCRRRTGLSGGPFPFPDAGEDPPSHPVRGHRGNGSPSASGRA